MLVGITLLTFLLSHAVPGRPGHREPGGAGRGGPGGRGGVPARVGARPVAPRAVRHLSLEPRSRELRRLHLHPAAGLARPPPDLSGDGRAGRRRHDGEHPRRDPARRPLGGQAGPPRSTSSTRVISLVGVSMPIFWLGLIALVVFYARLGWAPPPGRLSATLGPPPMVTGFLLIDSLLAGRPAVARDALQPPRAAGRGPRHLQPRHRDPPDARAARSTSWARTTSGPPGPRGSRRAR